MSTYAVLVFRDLKAGSMVPGSAKVAEFANAGAAIRHLTKDGWRVSGTSSNVFLKDNGLILHECRLIY